MGMFAAVSNDTQHALSIMLEDEEFVDFYVAENNRLVLFVPPWMRLFFQTVSTFNFICSICSTFSSC